MRRRRGATRREIHGTTSEWMNLLAERVPPVDGELEQLRLREPTFSHRTTEVQ